MVNLNKHHTAEVTNLQVMEDASGAPAVVVVGQYRFACDTLGRRTAVHCLNDTARNMAEQRSAAMKARHAYNTAVLFNTTASWRERNLAMYADIEPR